MPDFFSINGSINWGALIFGALLLYLILVIFLNRYRPSGDKVEYLNSPNISEEPAASSITLTIWNIGYAGLGKDSDFITDGGKSWLPPSKQTVQDNLTGIQKTLEKAPINAANITMLQEVSVKSPLNYWVPVRKMLLQHFQKHHATYRPDISSKGLPWPLKIAHGTMTLSRSKPKATQIIKLPAEPTFLGGLIKRNYALLVTRLPIKNTSTEWIIINLHLAAFDPNGATRHKQLKAVMAYANLEYAKGNFIIMGGDWNMALTPSDFPHTTDLENLFWLVNLPKKFIPTSWNIACDTATPTVRTNYQPYTKGQNYTAIIDGFITSPNVHVDTVLTTDTNFIHTDHMPVTATFSTKPVS